MSTTSIWNNFRTELFAFIITKVNDKEIANDILQDVFVKIHLKAGSLKQEEKLTSWVYQLTRNTIIDYYRKKNILTYTEEFQDIWDDDSESEDENKICVNCINPFIQQLPPNDRDALEQTVYGNISQKDYAEKTGLSYTATKSRIQRARGKLKDMFLNCCLAEEGKKCNC
ncbi:RNA polymerase sigma factor SigZ [Sediminitomix flava]|uniref:RNA polymerase sigma factor SigZ n=1 Tax=Sediminitomix flava TaxID=379075 RepID=A0A315ZCU8_SEDFL|nr:RNA polymerase sigma factor SigZ [Sediminitomix flava]PWJ43130.1 RNA polymerase sigma (SigZ) subunit [Sediminitomix flava]